MAHVYYSKVIEAPADVVWTTLGDFGSLPVWFPFVVRTELDPTGGGRVVGALRTNRIEDGTVVIEKLVELSDRDRCMAYAVVGGDAPVRDYSATLTVHEISDTPASLVTWTASFEPVGDPDPVIDWVRNGIFATCLEQLHRVLGPHSGEHHRPASL